MPHDAAVSERGLIAAAAMLTSSHHATYNELAHRVAVDLLSVRDRAKEIRMHERVEHLGELLEARQRSLLVRQWQLVHRQAVDVVVVRASEPTNVSAAVS